MIIFLHNTFQFKENGKWFQQGEDDNGLTTTAVNCLFPTNDDDLYDWTTMTNLYRQWFE